MALSTTVLAADFGMMLDDLPQTIIFESTSYPAVVHDIERGEDGLQDAGVLESYAIECQVRICDFPTLPTVGSKVTISFVEYRVVKIRDSACGLVRTLYLAEVTA